MKQNSTIVRMFRSALDEVVERVLDPFRPGPEGLALEVDLREVLMDLEYGRDELDATERPAA